jgi:hypothetical protein
VARQGLEGFGVVQHAHFVGKWGSVHPLERLKRPVSLQGVIAYKYAALPQFLLSSSDFPIVEG